MNISCSLKAHILSKINDVVPKQSHQLLLLLHPFNGLFSRTTWVCQYQNGKTSLDLNEARDAGVWDGSGISWTIYKQPAPDNTPTPHHSHFLQAGCSSCRPTLSVKPLKAHISTNKNIIFGI